MKIETAGCFVVKSGRFWIPALLSVFMFCLLAGCGRHGLKIETAPSSQLRLPKIFSHNMVLQCDQKVPIWGWAEPGKTVTVKIGGQEWSGETARDGSWKIDVGPLHVGTPLKIEVRSGKEKVLFKNVLVGEVWLASGQSNMEMAVGGWGKVLNYEQELAAANYPNIRLLTIPHRVSFTPQTDTETKGWVACNSKTLDNFSAVAYFFGRDLYKRYGVPIGLINSSFGGTYVEAWTSAAALQTIPEYEKQLAELDKLKTLSMKAAEEQYQKSLQEWQKMQLEKDPGFKDGKGVWAAPDLDTTDWKTMELPALWEATVLPNFDGVVWFRKDIQLSESWQNKKLVISLGAIDDRDITFFNGERVGGMDMFFAERRYEIPAKLVRAGKNTLTVRVLDTGGAGGFSGKPEQLFLKLADTEGTRQSISLAGRWLYKTGPDVTVLGPPPAPPSNPNQPSVLFNGMIAPLVPYGLRGAIWYQGESNAGRAYQYRELFPLMINDWRTHWKEGDFPFLFVQLANFGNWKPASAEPGDDTWAELREAQLLTLSVPKTGMAVAIDVGDTADIHPKNKQAVGERLALAARAIAYGDRIAYSGPVYKKDSLKIAGNKIRLEFDFADGGLTSKGDELKGFAIAGEDQKFVWAQAKIEDDSVIVWNEKIDHPVAVRYAWASDPACNLYNKDGLPASPFRTDNCKGITEGK